jgi:phosphatidylglycerophosphate synthase
MTDGDGLHRQTGVPEWETIPREEWNEWQIRADATNGWDTPGNRESAKGIVATALGLACLTNSSVSVQAAGIGLIGYGRYKDITDGRVAHETGTKSPKGEAVDATIDKIATAGAVAVAVTTESVPIPELSLIGIQQGANVILAGIAKRRGREIHPGRGGKVGMFGLWLGFGLHFVGNTLKNGGLEQAGDVMSYAGSVFTYTGVGLGAFSTIKEYIPAAFGRSKKSV